MAIIQSLLQGIPLPRMVKVRQKFDAPADGNVEQTLRNQIAKEAVAQKIQPGMRIAVAVGSRGLADLPVLVRVTVEELKKRGAHPFIVPAMGSHGGATAAGQKEVLANLGITEKTAGCSIISSMEVVEVGRLANGLAVLIDKQAHEADGIVVIARIKPHTAFRGASESGLAKMLTIGLGKQKGADSCHAYSFKYMAKFVVEMAKIKLNQCKFLFGVATVENAYDQIRIVEAVPAEDFIKRDQELLPLARISMAKLILNQIDVLIVDKIGKDISGDGMDPNITGRYPTPYARGGPEISKLVVLDLTERTHGNANGMGPADFTTRKLFNKIDYESTYANALTSTVCEPIRIPMILESDQQAIAAAIKTCNARELSKVRVVRIKNTLQLGEIYISEAMLSEAEQHEQLEVCSEPQLMKFDESGNLVS
jgi:hypothetical protein